MGFRGRLVLEGDWFQVDVIGICLSVLSMFLGLSLYSSLLYSGWNLSRFVLVRIICSIGRFIRSHALLF